MKKLLPFALVLALSSCVKTPYSISDNGTLLKEDKPIGKIEGEIGVGKPANLTFSTDQGPYLRIEGHEWSCNYPALTPSEHFLFRDIPYYTLEFPKQNTKINLLTYGTFYNEKQVFKYIITKNEIKLTANGISEEQVKLLEAKDQTQEIKEDSLKGIQKIEFYQDQLKHNTLYAPRDYDHFALEPVPYKMRNIIPEEAHRVLFKLSSQRDDDGNRMKPVVVGYMRKSGPTPQEQNAPETITILRKLEKPAEFNGQTYHWLPLAYVNMSSNRDSYFNFATGKYVSIDVELETKTTEIYDKVLRSLQDNGMF